MKYFFNYGVDVNLKDVNGEILFFWVVENGYFDVVKMLICINKCYINDFNVVYQMLIYCVVKYGYIEIVNYLLFKGGDKIIVDKYGCFLVEMV